jgi:hypothetical protein
MMMLFGAMCCYTRKRKKKEKGGKGERWGWEGKERKVEGTPDVIFSSVLLI